MEKPLFGDENSKLYNILFLIGSGTLGLILFVSTVISIVFAIISHWQHAVFAVFLILLLIPLGILLYWERFSYVEKKVRVITIMLPILIIFGVVVGQVYIWGLWKIPFPGDSCRGGRSNGNVGMFRYKYNKIAGKCYEVPTNLLGCMNAGNNCLKISDPKPSDPNSIARVIGCAFYNATSNECGFPKPKKVVTTPISDLKSMETIDPKQSEADTTE